MKTLHGLVDDPVIYLACLFVGTSLIAYTAAFWISDFRLKRAGGTSGREFPARMKGWDQLEKFTVWQASWLWNDLEPMKPEQGQSEGTPSYPTYRRLKEHLNQGMIKGATKVNGSWGWTHLTRQQLIDYALEIEQKPKFLFPSERHSALVRWVTNFCHAQISHDEISAYEDFHTYCIRLAQACVELKNRGAFPDYSLSDLRKKSQEMIKYWLSNGALEAIGRKRRYGQFFYYERISSDKWEFIDIDSYGNLFWAHEEYADVRVKADNEKIKELNSEYETLYDSVGHIEVSEPPPAVEFGPPELAQSNPTPIQAEDAPSIAARTENTFFYQWDLADHLTVAQAACLWCEREPIDSFHFRTQKTPELAAIEQMLVSAISDGRLRADSSKNALAIIGDYEKSLIRREDLARFAESKGRKPKFLFPEER